MHASTLCKVNLENIVGDVKLSFQWSVKHYHMAFEWHSLKGSEKPIMDLLYYCCLTTCLLDFSSPEPKLIGLDSSRCSSVHTFKYKYH